MEAQRRAAFGPARPFKRDIAPVLLDGQADRGVVLDRPLVEFTLSGIPERLKDGFGFVDRNKVDGVFIEGCMSRFTSDWTL